MTNRLADASSLYLRQHAENPVDWHEWGPDAFALARERDVPIFLSVGYASCHWCHVMARETFSDPEVAAQLNAEYVAVKVDREERPDVDAIYMAAANAMTQGNGGWPMTVLLTPDGRPFHAGTYYPREQVLELLTEATGAWQHHRDAALNFADQLTASVRRALGGPSDAAATAPRTDDLRALITSEQLGDALANLTAHYDAEHPGFGQAPKFPPNTALMFLLRHHARTGAANASAMAQRIGDAMARGGIHDLVGGGFARYATGRAWTVPHFEKMLYDNAQLLRAYAHLWDVSHQPIFERAARGIVAFLRRDLRVGGDDDGFALAASLNAESLVDGRPVEGGSYVWTLPQLDAALGLGSGRLAAEIFHAHPEGNAGPHLPGASVLTLGKDPADVVGTILKHHANAPIPDAAKEDADAWFAGVLGRLAEVRAARPQPERDDKIVLAWNGLAVTALAEAGRIFGEPTWIEDADAVARYLLGAHRVDTADGASWRRTSTAGTAGEGVTAGSADATSADLGNLAEGLLALHDATGDTGWLDAAREVLDDAITLFAADDQNPGAGGFYDVPAAPSDGVALLVRPRTISDATEPSGTAALAGALLRYGQAAGDSRYRLVAQRAVATLAPLAVAEPLFSGAVLAAAEGFLS